MKPWATSTRIPGEECVNNSDSWGPPQRPQSECPGVGPETRTSSGCTKWDGDPRVGEPPARSSMGLHQPRQGHTLQPMAGHLLTTANVPLEDLWRGDVGRSLTQGALHFLAPKPAVRRGTGIDREAWHRAHASIMQGGGRPAAASSGWEVSAQTRDRHPCPVVLQGPSPPAAEHLRLFIAVSLSVSPSRL